MTCVLIVPYSRVVLETEQSSDDNALYYITWPRQCINKSVIECLIEWCRQGKYIPYLFANPHPLVVEYVLSTEIVNSWHALECLNENINMVECSPLQNVQKRLPEKIPYNPAPASPEVLLRLPHLFVPEV